MKDFSRLATITVVLICILCTFIVPMSGNAYTIDAQYGFNSVPAELRCSYEFSSESLTALSNACLAWNWYCPYEIVKKSSQPTYDVPKNGIYYFENGYNQVTKYSFGSRSGIAYTYRFFDGSGGSAETESVTSPYSLNADVGINEADICLNTRYSFGTADTSYNVQTVLTHEIGHLLGFGHSSDSNAIMYYAILPNDKRGVSTDDIYALDHIYHILR